MGRVEPLFQFIGQYWWLAFPLFGVMASIGSAWERGARRRHKRRLEVLHAKAELKAAQAAARGKTGPIPVSPPNPYADRVNAAVAAAMGTPAASTAAVTSQSVGAQLERLFASHDAVIARWLDYELDVAKIIAFPAMSDGRQPLTAAFLRAKKIADGLRPASVKTKLTREQLTEYRAAVTDFEVAFDVAERDARRIKDSTFSEVERKRLDTAKKLLTVAIDQAATPAERQLAYRRVREQLDGLISLSDEAIEVLEAKVALELTTGPVSRSAPRGPAPEVLQVPPAEPPRAAPAPSTTPPPPAARPAPDLRGATWPVPARNAGDAPGRVVHPKSHP